MSRAQRELNWKRRFKMCGSKKRYRSLEDAKAGSEQYYLWTHGDVLDSYACPFCKGFHNGHNKRATQRATEVTCHR